MPETTEYLLLGLAAVGLSLGGYIVSLFVRLSNARRTITVLEDLRDEA